jgi:hypothetical protein
MESRVRAEEEDFDRDDDWVGFGSRSHTCLSDSVVLLSSQSSSFPAASGLAGAYAN